MLKRSHHHHHRVRNPFLLKPGTPVVHYLITVGRFNLLASVVFRGRRDLAVGGRSSSLLMGVPIFWRPGAFVGQRLGERRPRFWAVLLLSFLADVLGATLLVHGCPS